MDREIVVFDLDGTLANIEHRRHLIEKPEKVDADWRAFYAACADDEPNHPVVAVWRAHGAAGHERWIVSGRSDEVSAKTAEWLARHALWPARLLMREARNHEPDVKLKRRWLNDGTIPRERVLCVYDDRSSVVAMWREEGLACFQVAPGDF